MKVYVDELPKECWDCPCFRNDTDFSCGLSDGTKDYFLDEIDGGECPLKSLKDHDKQLRSQICEDIKDQQHVFTCKYDNHTYFMQPEFESLLEEIERGEDAR